MCKSLRGGVTLRALIRGVGATLLALIGLAWTGFLIFTIVWYVGWGGRDVWQECREDGHSAFYCVFEVLPKD